MIGDWLLAFCQSNPHSEQLKVLICHRVRGRAGKPCCVVLFQDDIPLVFFSSNSLNSGQKNEHQLSKNLLKSQSWRSKPAKGFRNIPTDVETGKGNCHPGAPTQHWQGDVDSMGRSQGLGLCGPTQTMSLILPELNLTLCVFEFLGPSTHIMVVL